MRNVVRLALALAVVALIASPALAQRPGGGGGFGGGFGGGDALSLLSQKSVQEELKLTEDQVKKGAEAQEKLRQQRPAGGGAGGQRPTPEELRARMEERRKTVEKALAEFLKPEQVTRLNQIALQQTEKNAGITAAVQSSRVAEALKLTDDQKELLKAIGEDQRKLMQDLFQGGAGGGNREETQKKLADFRKSSGEKFTKTLSEEQKAAWKGLVGAEFTGKIEAPMRRPGGGGR